MGLLLTVVVHAANIQDRDGAKLVFKRTPAWVKRLKTIWADGGYAGKLIDAAKELHGWTLTIIKRSDGVQGFKVLPKRWLVERTFAWFDNYRRPSKDYEYHPETSETMIYIAMIHLMVRRLARCSAF